MNFSCSVKTFFIFILMFVSSWALAQHIDNHLDFQNIYKQHIHINKSGMWILGGWAGCNIFLSGFFLFKTQGESKYFHLMNVAWNAINLCIAGFGLYDAYTLEFTSPQQTLNLNLKMQKILLFNTGLDVGYIMTGFFLMEKAKNTQKLPERLSGFGKSVVLQGVFLLVFDAVMVVFHSFNEHS